MLQWVNCTVNLFKSVRLLFYCRLSPLVITALLADIDRMRCNSSEEVETGLVTRLNWLASRCFFMGLKRQLPKENTLVVIVHSGCRKKNDLKWLVDLSATDFSIFKLLCKY